jgi:hypothetical protein
MQDKAQKRIDYESPDLYPSLFARQRELSPQIEYAFIFRTKDCSYDEDNTADVASKLFDVLFEKGIGLKYPEIWNPKIFNFYCEDGMRLLLEYNSTK